LLLVVLCELLVVLCELLVVRCELLVVLCVQKDDVPGVRCDRLQILLHEILAFRPFQILALKQIDEDCPLEHPQSLLT
jgi:uncharacterized protein YhhL (DUF1145 family)